MRSKHRAWNKNAVLAIVLVLAIIAAGLLALNAWEKRRYKIENAGMSMYIHDNKAEIYYNGKLYTEKDKLETILLLGLDKYEDPALAHDGYSNTEQSDFLLLLVIDHDSQSYTALHLNRDTMADVPVLGVTGSELGVEFEQLALSHTYGSGGLDSCRNTGKAVSNLLYGIHIDHYISVTMDAVGALNDLVGGVPVKVEDDFSGVDDTLVQGETVNLNAEQALHFVRARGELKADKTNLNRMSRQKAYIHSFREQFLSKMRDDENFALDALNAVANYTVSDCTINRLSEMASTVGDYKMTELLSPEGEAVKGEEFMEFYPYEDALKKLVVELFFEPSGDE